MTQPAFTPAAHHHDATPLIHQAIQLLTDAMSDQSPGGIDDFLTPSELLWRLVDGVDGVDIDGLGVPITGSRIVVVTDATGAGVEHLSRGIPLPKRVVTTRYRERWVVLVPGLPTRTGAVDAALTEARRLASHVSSEIRRPANVGVSARIDCASRLRQAYRDAADLCALAARRGEPLLTVDEAWPLLATARLHDAVAAALPVGTPLDRLAALDAENTTDFGGTVGTWLSLGCDTDKTSRALCIHPNTLRYRLKRAQALTGIDLTDATQRLLLQLTQPVRRP